MGIAELNKFTIGTILILLTHSGTSLAIESQTPALTGAWEVYKDDDTPNVAPNYEVMNFWSNGVFCIARDRPYKGTYYTKTTKLFLVVELTDRSIEIDRIFQLSHGELKFKNEKVGWVYYKRISEKPMDNCLASVK